MTEGTADAAITHERPTEYEMRSALAALEAFWREHPNGDLVVGGRRQIGWGELIRCARLARNVLDRS